MVREHWHTDGSPILKHMTVARRPVLIRGGDGTQSRNHDPLGALWAILEGGEGWQDEREETSGLCHTQGLMTSRPKKIQLCVVASVWAPSLSVAAGSKSENFESIHNHSAYAQIHKVKD